PPQRQTTAPTPVRMTVRPPTTATPAPNPPAKPAPNQPPARVAPEPAAAPVRLPPGSPPMPNGKSATASRAQLDQAYAKAQQQMEQRHEQEFAKPPKGETMPELRARQDSEHRDLSARYQQAAAAGSSKLPPAPKPARPAAKPPRQSGKEKPSH
ncbi:MAG TPA: hypothetical protein VGR59_12070, partial [Gemmatimonadaceae bacterium]|nr:hypothetical protein [Gemmatimonadaceae bacterium]